MSIPNEETRLLSVEVFGYGSVDGKKEKKKDFPVDVLHWVAAYLTTQEWMTAMHVCYPWRIRFYRMIERYSGTQAKDAHELMFKLLSERLLLRRTALEKYPSHEPFIISIYCAIFALPGILLLMGIQLRFDLPEEISYSFVGTSGFLLSPSWIALSVGVLAYGSSAIKRESQRKTQSICVHHGCFYNTFSIVLPALKSNEVRGSPCIPSTLSITGSLVTIIGCWWSVLYHLDGHHTPDFMWFVLFIVIIALSYPLKSAYSSPTFFFLSVLVVLFPVLSFLVAFAVHFMSIGIYSMYGTMTAVCSVFIGCILCIAVPNLSPTESCLNAWSASFLALLYADVVVECDRVGITVVPILALVVMTSLWIANLLAQAKAAWRPRLRDSLKVLLFTLPSLLLSTALSLVALDISHQAIVFTILFISIGLVPSLCWELVLLETHIDTLVKVPRWPKLRFALGRIN